jgi:uncharacterized phage protein gp47/JayE
MTTNRPLLFKKSADDLQEQIRKELRETIHWRAQQDGAGQGMVRLFGRLAEIIVDRLNRVPEQHFLAFLNEGGIDQLAPRAASTELVFLAEKEARPAISVLAGTQVATRPAGGQPEIIFETLRDVQVIPTELTACIAVDQRTCGDCTAQANGQARGSFAMFQGDTVRERVLYLGHDPLLAFADPIERDHAVITLHVDIAPVGNGAGLGAWELQWLFWNGKMWARLPDAGAHIQDGTDSLCHSGVVELTHLPELGKTKIEGVEQCWLACRLVPRAEQLTFPTIGGIQIARKISVDEQQAPIRAAFTCTQAGMAFAPLKVGDAFYPFGQRPALLDAFYVQADEALLKPGATVQLRMALPGLLAVPEDTSELDKLVVEWEYFSTAGWTRLGSSRWGCPELDFLDPDDPSITGIHLAMHSSGVPYLRIDLPENYHDTQPPSSLPGGTLRYYFATAQPYVELPVSTDCGQMPASVLERGRSYQRTRLDFYDNTCAFLAKGVRVVSFKAPGLNPDDPPFAMTEVNSLAGYWLRARIVDGSYSVPQPRPGNLISKLLIGNMPKLPPEPAPPLVNAMQVVYTDYRVETQLEPLAHCWSQTDFRWRSHADGQPFAPFTASIEHPALYLGFNPLDQDPAKGRVAFPANTWIELALDVEDLGDEIAADRVRWEYWNGVHWRHLEVVDETRGLRKRGLLGFFGPPDHRASAEFGKLAHWLRVYPVGPNDLPGKTPVGARWMPRLNVVHLNVAPVVNAQTVVDEVLGSSSGEKDQVFRLAQSPVLPDLQIEVREPGEQLNQPAETWVLWSRVANFGASNPTSRCYLLDAVAGAVTFGNGERGMVPPAGHNNIRARQYRTHAGAAGNLPANTVTVMRTPKGALNEIRRVANHEPAFGGSEAEETASVMERAPYSLKNRHRSVAKEDYEWLAREVEGACRAFCLPTRKRDGTVQAGWVTVVVVPDSASAATGSEKRPIPSPGLLREVRAYLEQRCLTNLAPTGAGRLAEEMTDPDQIHVTGPGFVEVQVRAQVTPRNPTQADATRKAIEQQLGAFLNPLAGGPDRRGWEPGRDVFVSEIAAEIERTPGVDHLVTISLHTPARQQQLVTLASPAEPLEDVPVGSQVSTIDERLKLVLGAALSESEPITEFNVFGLNVGDRAHLIAAGGATEVDTRVIGRLATLFEIGFDRSITFADRADYGKWLKDLGSAPVLAAKDGHFWLPIPSMGEHAQFATVVEPSGSVTLSGVAITDRRRTHALAIGAEVGIVGGMGARPIDVRSVSTYRDSRSWIVFDQPIDLAGEQAFADWLKRLGAFPSLTSADHRISLPITGYDKMSDATGRVHVAGVIVQGLEAEELVVLTDATRHRRRVKFLPVQPRNGNGNDEAAQTRQRRRVEFLRVQTALPWVEEAHIFVPADHLVCSGSHEIVMV